MKIHIFQLHSRFYSFLLFLIICLSLSCKKEGKEVNQENLALNLNQNQTVIINGTSDDKGFNKSITFYDDSFFYDITVKDKNIKKEVEGDSTTMTLKNIKTPKILELISFGENAFYRTRMIVTPGDSVSYALKEGKLIFSGINKEHYNFFLEMDPENDDWSQLYLDKYNPNFEKYKQQCDSLYKKRLDFFETYIKKYPNVSENFKKLVSDELRLEYLVNIIKPRSEIASKWNVNTGEDLINIYERGNKQEGEFFDINGYLNNITLEEINHPEYVNNMYFQMSIVPLIRQHFVKSSETPFSLASFKEELTFLKKNFHPSIVDYATSKLIFTYFNRGFGKDKNTAAFMKNAINEYKETVDDPNIIRVMEDIETELNTTNKRVPNELNELVLSLSKDTVSIRNILNQKKIKVIDFWASWCHPCIEEIIKSKYKRERIASEYNVEFLYLSIDKDTQKWMDKSIDLYEFLPTEQQFKIFDQKKSKLIKFLNLESSYGMAIPRYVILDENNIIIDNNAPKPSEDNFEEVLKTIQ